MKWLSLFAAGVIGIVIFSMPPGQAYADKNQNKIPELFESSFAHEATGNSDRALNDTLKILRLDPGHYTANYRAGWLYYMKGRYKDSIKFYTKATTINPKSLEAKLAVMLPLMAAKKWSQAEKIAKQVLTSCSNNYLAGSRLAYIYFSQGKYKPAEEQYLDVLENYPSEIDMMLGLGWTYLKMGKRSGAKNMFEKVLSIRRQNLNARAGLEAL